MNAHDENELFLALHNLLEAVEKARNCNASDAFYAIKELLEIAAEERGAFSE